MQIWEKHLKDKDWGLLIWNEAKTSLLRVGFHSEVKQGTNPHINSSDEL